MAMYSFRADCESHVDILRDVFSENGIGVALTVGHVYPNIWVNIEIETDTEIEVIRDAMRFVMDGHVMLQTLRPCRLFENSLVRDLKLY